MNWHQGLAATMALALISVGCMPAPSDATASPISGSPDPTTTALDSAAAPIPSETTVTASAKAPAKTASFPDPSRFVWAQVATGLDAPTDIQFPNDGTGRMFIVEQPGRIRIIQNGQLLSTAFLDVTDRVDSQGSEQGLLGLAFHPLYSENGLFFVSYTDKQKHDVIARFHVSDAPERADPSSEVVLTSVDDPFPNHNGGVLAFGPDGYLYAGLGDGGSANDPFGNGQNTNTLLGKILRLDVNHGDPYAIPADNPFLHGEGRPEIWAYGLRNPWRLSFDKGSGDLYIADVGQDTWEEVDFLPAGGAGGTNFGWNYREASHPFRGNPPASAHLTYPVAEYSHADGSCAVIGGYVYRGQMLEWQGVYFYGDYCSGKIWGLLNPADSSNSPGWTSGLLFETGKSITAFGQDPGGELYFADRNGPLYRLESAP